MVKILIVDDEPAYCDSLRMLLSCEGFEARTAASGREALEIAKDFPADLLVVNWILRNDMDGLEVAEALRPANPKMQVIVITGYPSGELEKRVKALPFAQCLHKPFEAGTVIDAARKIAEGSE